MHAKDSKIMQLSRTKIRRVSADLSGREAAGTGASTLAKLSSRLLFAIKVWDKYLQSIQ